jgi:hypothetical protein
VTRQSTRSPTPNKHRRHHPRDNRKHKGKERVLTHKKPSQVESIAHAVVIENEDIFFLSAVA